MNERGSDRHSHTAPNVSPFGRLLGSIITRVAPALLRVGIDVGG